MITMLRTIPAMPVLNIDKAVLFYQNKLNFNCRHQEETFAILQRDEIEIHLWAACDHWWKLRSLLLFLRPVWSGAESFLAGTASCRIEVQNISELYIEYKRAGVLYDQDTEIESTHWQTLEFSALDLHRNLLTFYQRSND